MATSVKKDETGIREMGLKLANFRKKLAFAIGQKKITQGEFGEMFGGYSGRVIASYELGDVDPPASLLYAIWKQGNSIDNIFSEGPVTEPGRKIGGELYENTITANLRAMDLAERERVLREVNHAKRPQNGATQETAVRTSGKRKTSHNTPGKTKKR